MSATATSEPSPQSAATGGAVRRFYLRFQHLVHELGKFGVVGSVAFAVDTALYAYLLYGPQLETLTAKTLTTVISATVAFLGNRFWTWRHRERSGLAREYSLYFFFNVVGLVIGLACLGISHYGLGSVWPAFGSNLADLIAGNIVGTFFGTMFRFWSYRRFVFLAPAAAPLDEPAAPVGAGEPGGPQPPGDHDVTSAAIPTPDSSPGARSPVR